MIARTFMRMCAIETLCPTALIVAGATDAAAWPTLAMQHVFDSRMAPIDDLDPNERRPIIAIYSDLHNFDRISQSANYKSVLDIVIELSVVQEIVIPDSDGITDVIYAVTDGELEAKLDVLEEQIAVAWHTSPLIRKIAKFPFDDWQSSPHRSSEESIRLAMRTIRLKVPLVEACYNAAPSVAPEGIARLPRIYRDIAEMFPEGSYAAGIIASLAPAVPSRPVAVPFTGVTFNHRVGDPAAQPVDDPENPDPDKAPHIVASADNLQS